MKTSTFWGAFPSYRTELISGAELLTFSAAAVFTWRIQDFWCWSSPKKRQTLNVGETIINHSQSLHKIGSINHSQMGKQLFQWIGFKETLQETPIFDGENPWFPVKVFPSTNSVIICKKWGKHQQSPTPKAEMPKRPRSPKPTPQCSHKTTTNMRENATSGLWKKGYNLTV